MLSGCCWKKDHLPQIKLDIPESLLMETKVPEFTGKTNRDLVNWTTLLMLSVDNCNADKHSIKNILEKTK